MDVKMQGFTQFAPGETVTLVIPDGEGNFVYHYTVKGDGFTYVYDSTMDQEETYDECFDALTVLDRDQSKSFVVFTERPNPNLKSGWEVIAFYK